MHVLTFAPLYVPQGAAPVGTTGILRQHTDEPAKGFSGVAASQLGGVLVHAVADAVRAVAGARLGGVLVH